MEHRKELLKYVVTQSAANVGPNYPHGYMHIVGEQEAGATELHNAGLVVAHTGHKNPDGSFPVVPTEAGVKLSQEAAVQAATVQQPAAASQGATFAVRIDTDIPMPAGKPRGFQSTGGSAVERYRFNDLPIGGSIHIPPSGDPEKPIHRTFSSVVSQANNKLFPKHFTIREVDASDPGGAGARVWRDPDMQGEKPTRAPRKPKPAPAAAPGFPAPGAGFGAPSQGAGGGGPIPGAGVPEGFGAAPAPAPGAFGAAPPAAPPVPGGFGAGTAPGGFVPPGFGS
jgi:hypothetical protein